LFQVFFNNLLGSAFETLPHFERGTEDDSWIGFIHDRLWGPICKGMLSGLVQADSLQREQFDDEQRRIIGELELNRRVIVEGPAGSGKTIIAVEAAHKIAEQGKPVFYLCFTEALAAWLRSARDLAGVQVHPIKRLAEKFLQEAGKLLPKDIPAKLGTEEARRFFESVSERALSEAKDEIVRARAAAVVIDEAQDFQPDDWRLARCLAGDEGNIWAFADPYQKFVANAKMPETGFYYRELYKQYRSHATILALANALAGREASIS
jgi:Rad3-related DNA helicase